METINLDYASLYSYMSATSSALLKASMDMYRRTLRMSKIEKIKNRLN